MKHANYYHYVGGAARASASRIDLQKPVRTPNGVDAQQETTKILHGHFVAQLVTTTAASAASLIVCSKATAPASKNWKCQYDTIIAKAGK